MSLTDCAYIDFQFYIQNDTALKSKNKLYDKSQLKKKNSSSRKQEYAANACISFDIKFWWPYVYTYVS